MTDFYEITALKNDTIQYLHAIRDEIDFDPIYQRQGDVWSTKKRQLLLDSILNDFDVPKIYFHQYAVPARTADGRRFQYALVDGKQRLSAIFDFIDGRYALSEDFELFSNPEAKLAGRTYSELKKEEPRLGLTFDSTSLDIVVIKTNEVELIEEMFYRLNEAAPLNAAEKRNSISGPCRTAVRQIVQHDFFDLDLPFSNKRYRHYDLAAKFLLWEYNNLDPAAEPLVVSDVKRVRLDKFFEVMKEQEDGQAVIAKALGTSVKTMDNLHKVFTTQDPLLQSVGSVSVFYLLFMKRAREGRRYPNRIHIKEFENNRRNRYPLEEDSTVSQGILSMLEYNRLTQSPNDSSALKRRLEILDVYLTALEQDRDPLVAVSDFTHAD